MQSYYELIQDEENKKQFEKTEEGIIAIKEKLQKEKTLYLDTLTRKKTFEILNV